MRVALHNSYFTRAESVTPNRRGVARTRVIRKPSAVRWPACVGIKPSHSRVDSALASGEIANAASVGGGVTDKRRDKASRCNGGEPKALDRAGEARARISQAVESVEYRRTPRAAEAANRPSILAANHGKCDKAINSPNIDARSYVGRDLRFSICNERIRQ